MATTGQIGTSDSQPGNIQPGAADASPPPPPPPPATPAGILVATVARNFPVPHPTNRMRPTLYYMPLPLTGPPGAVEQAFDNTQIQCRPPQRNPAAGPWNPQFSPMFKELVTVTLAGVPPFSPPTVPPEIYPAFPTRATPAPGPWNSFGGSRIFPPLTPVPAPPPPGVPPVPPPGTAFGPPRQSETRVMRVPESLDDRIRPHFDKVAGIFNSLFRQGYIVQTSSGEFAIMGGGRSLPRAPAPDDDIRVGAVVGQVFVNTLDGTIYVCVDNSDGSAVWRQIYP